MGLYNTPSPVVSVTLYNSSGTIDTTLYSSDPGADVSRARGIGNTAWFVWNFSAPTPNAANYENITPVVSNANISLNIYNYTADNQNITASVNATDNIAIQNVKCYIRNIANTASDDSTTTVSGNTYTCAGLRAPTQDDYQITFTATDTSSNTNTTAPINFTTKLTTQGQLNVPSNTPVISRCILQCRHINKHVLVSRCSVIYRRISA